MLEMKEAGRNPEIALTGETDFTTFDDCLDYWFSNKVNTLKKGTQELYTSVAKNYFYGSTGISELGVAPHVVEKMLGHDLGGVLAVYNKHDWLDEQLEAYNAYGDMLFKHVEMELTG